MKNISEEIKAAAQRGGKAAQALRAFSFDEKEVRTQLRNDGPWFVLQDVCDVLGVGNVTDVTKRIPQKDRHFDSIEVEGVKRRMLFVSEPGLYRVIMRSRKPNAERFTDWVVSEVLPSIRRTGSYHVGDAPAVAAPDDIEGGSLKDLLRVSRTLLEIQDAHVEASARTRDLADRLLPDAEALLGERDARIAVLEAELAATRTRMAAVAEAALTVVEAEGVAVALVLRTALAKGIPREDLREIAERRSRAGLPVVVVVPGLDPTDRDRWHRWADKVPGVILAPERDGEGRRAETLRYRVHGEEGP